jgi:hypothetical protein
LVIRDPDQLVETIEGWARVQQALGGQDVVLALLTTCKGSPLIPL